MAQKLVRLGIVRDPTYLYFVRRGDVWRIARQPKSGNSERSLPEKVAEGGARMDSAYIYFLDREGDLARVKRALRTPKRLKKTASKAHSAKS